MFFYTSSNRFQGKLVIQNLGLTKKEEWIRQAAIWAEQKWGYIRLFPGLDYRIEAIRKLQEKFFIATYGGKPVAMFALMDYKAYNGLSGKELMYFYVDESFRGLGLGKQLFTLAQQECKAQNADLIVFDTLNINLNHFYEKCGAKVICDGQLLGHPTTVMRI